MLLLLAGTEVETRAALLELVEEKALLLLLSLLIGERVDTEVVLSELLVEKLLWLLLLLRVDEEVDKEAARFELLVKRLETAVRAASVVPLLLVDFSSLSL